MVDRNACRFRNYLIIWNNETDNRSLYFFYERTFCDAFPGRFYYP